MATPQDAGEPRALPGSSSIRARAYDRLDKANAAVLMVDHQSGLTNLVQDYRCLISSCMAGKNAKG